MSSKPGVSVIIIFLNAEKFIREAIESVLAQTYDSWELLLVDDGSTDGSTAIALRYTAQYSGRIRYLEHANHQNRQMSASRNLGISHAKGEYIAFLDADDVWLPHKLEQQVAILDAQPETAMVYGPSQFWYSWTGRPEDRQRDFVGKLGVPPNTLFKPPTLLILFLRGEVGVPCPCNIMVRREAIKGIGRFEEEFCVITRGMYEDQVFYVKVYLKAPVFVAGECWDKYRRHPDSACSIEKKMGRYYSARPTFLNWLAEYLSEQEFKDTEIGRLLQKEIFWCHHPRLYRLLIWNRRLLGRIKRLWVAKGVDGGHS